MPSNSSQMTNPSASNPNLNNPSHFYNMINKSSRSGSIINNNSDLSTTEETVVGSASSVGNQKEADAQSSISAQSVPQSNNSNNNTR